MRGLGRAATESARQVPRCWWVHQGVSSSRNRLMMHGESGRHITPPPPNCQISTCRMLTFGSRGSPATHPKGAARVVSQCKINDIVRRAAQNTRRPFLRAWQSRISHVRRHGFGAGADIWTRLWCRHHVPFVLGQIVRDCVQKPSFKARLRPPWSASDNPNLPGRSISTTDGGPRATNPLQISRQILSSTVPAVLQTDTIVR